MTTLFDDLDEAMPTLADTTSTARFVTLRGSVTVREDALRLALALEAQGHQMTVAEGKLIVSDGARLTPETVARIKSHRMDLLTIAAYVAP